MMLEKPTKKIHNILVFSIILIIFSSSFNLVSAQRGNVNEKPIEFSVNVWPPNFLAYIAQEKGYFEKNNVNVNLTLIQDYADAVEDYVNREHDGMFIVYSDALIQNSQGIDTKVVYNVDTSYDADAIIGNVDNLTDVNGKKVGVEGINSFSHYFVLKSLENVGLDEGNVEFVNIPAQNISEAIKKGEIDAGHTYNPYMSDAVKDGFNILSIGADTPGAISTVIAFHSDIVKQRPQDIQNFIKSLIEAKEDYDKNTDEDIELMSLKTGINKTEIIDGMNGAKLLDLDYNAQISMNK